MRSRKTKTELLYAGVTYFPSPQRN